MANGMVTCNYKSIFCHSVTCFGKAAGIGIMFARAEAPNSPKTRMMNGVLLLVFPGPNAQPFVHDPPRASICHQGTEACLLELHRFMTLGGSGFPDSPNTIDWPPLAFQGLAPMDQLSKSRTKKTSEPPKCHWLPATGFQRVQNPDPNKLHNACKSSSRQTTTSTKSMVSRNLTMRG